MDTFDIDLLNIIPLIILGVAQSSAHAKTPMNTGLPGGDYLRELLDSGNSKRIYRILRMKKETFTSLCSWLQINGGLENTRNVLVEEQVAIFLWIINFNTSMSIVAERFQHSTETISR
jgi:hypothetical protein